MEEDECFKNSCNYDGELVADFGLFNPSLRLKRLQCHWWITMVGHSMGFWWQVCYDRHCTCHDFDCSRGPTKLAKPPKYPPSCNRSCCLLHAFVSLLVWQRPPSTLGCWWRFNPSQAWNILLGMDLHLSAFRVAKTVDKPALRDKCAPGVLYMSVQDTA